MFGLKNKNVFAKVAVKVDDLKRDALIKEVECVCVEVCVCEKKK